LSWKRSLVGLDPRARVAKELCSATYYYIFLPKHALFLALAESFYLGVIGMIALDAADQQSLQQAIFDHVAADLKRVQASQNLVLLYGRRCLPLSRRKEAVICLADPLHTSQGGREFVA
jgi:hypothetical protein